MFKDDAHCLLRCSSVVLPVGLSCKVSNANVIKLTSALTLHKRQHLLLSQMYSSMACTNTFPGMCCCTGSMRECCDMPRSSCLNLYVNLHSTAATGVLKHSMTCRSTCCYFTAASISSKPATSRQHANLTTSHAFTHTAANTITNPS